ncbi:MAG: DUF3313 domain-containing protein, partial [Planctomycetota bacterium]
MCSNFHRRLSGRFFLIGLLLLCFVLSACATTRQSPGDVDRSGFLGDYSQLREGEGDEPQLIYINPAANWTRYNAILIDSVTIWRNAETEDVSIEDQQRLTDSLYAALHKQLGADYQIADRAAPGVLRLRAAITEAKGARVVMNTVTSIVPQLRLLTTVGG